MCKIVMTGCGSMLAETDDILYSNVKEMRKTCLTVLDMLASAAAEIEARKERPAVEGTGSNV
jgi:hypothetical protein